MVVVGEVTFGEPVQYAFGGGCGGVPITFLRGGCVCVVLLGLGQWQRLCIGCGVEYSAVREDVEALGGELEDDVPLRCLLWGPLVGPVLRSVEGDLVAPSPAVVKRYGVLHPYPLPSLWRSSPGQIRNFPVDATAS